MIQNVSEDFLVINFLKVEETPLMERHKAGILTFFLLLNLLFGLLIQSRIFFILHVQGKDGSMIAIDRLFISHNYVTMTCQPVLIIYIIFSHYIYPMIDYVGLPGCIIIPQFVNVFSAVYYLVFPLTIAVVRFFFIVHSNWVKSFGINKLINTALVLTILIPAVMTLSLQYPVSDYIHGPFNLCRGRFEVFFNPTHPDPISPGRREGERHCIETGRWAFETASNDEVLPQAIRIVIFISCKLSRNLFYLLSFSVPEMVLYPVLFVHISAHNKSMASAGMLNPDILRRRHKQNLINIYMTFWAWLVQFMTNILMVIAVKFLFSTDLFTYQFVAFLNFFFNFNVLPFVYILLAKDNFKKALVQKKLGLLLKLLFTFEA